MNPEQRYFAMYRTAHRLEPTVLRHLFDHVGEKLAEVAANIPTISKEDAAKLVPQLVRHRKSELKDMPCRRFDGRGNCFFKCVGGELKFNNPEKEAEVRWLLGED